MKLRFRNNILIYLPRNDCFLNVVSLAHGFQLSVEIHNYFHFLTPCNGIVSDAVCPTRIHSMEILKSIRNETGTLPAKSYIFADWKL